MRYLPKAQPDGQMQHVDLICIYLVYDFIYIYF